MDEGKWRLPGGSWSSPDPNGPPTRGAAPRTAGHGPEGPSFHARTASMSRAGSTPGWPGIRYEASSTRFRTRSACSVIHLLGWPGSSSAKGLTFFR